MYLDPVKRHSTPDIWTTHGAKMSPRLSQTMIPRISISSCRGLNDHPHKFMVKQSRRRHCRSPLRRWCKITGWHGVLDCYQARSTVARAFWAIIVLVAGLLGANQIFSMLHDYWSEDQWVTSMHFTDAGSQGLPMPNVTLCSLNQFNQSYMDWLHIEPSMLMMAKSQSQYAFYQRYLSARPIYQNTSGFDEAMREDLTRIVQLLTRFRTEGKVDVKDFMKNASHSCKASVLACGLTTDPTMENGASCCEKNQYEAAEHCIHLGFNHPNGEPIHIRSEASGVYLLLHPRLDDYNPVFLSETMPAAGFTVTLSLKENTQSAPIILSPGTHNVIWMTLEKRRTVTRKMMNAVHHLYYLKPPCVEIQEYKILEEEYYNPESCRLDCVLQLSLETCGCVLSNGQSVRKTFNICNAGELVACGMKKANDTSSTAQLIKCQSRCIEPCRYGRIKVWHNAAQFPAPKKAVSMQRYVSRVVGEDFSMDDVRQLISVHLVYETMYVRSVEKFNRVSLDELISNIGGAMGVWTGISLISIIQVFAYVMHYAYRMAKTRHE